MSSLMSGIEVDLRCDPDQLGRILPPSLLRLLGDLHHRFESRRVALMERRELSLRRAQERGRLDFLGETAAIRESDWAVAPAPRALQDRRVEITGPVERKMMINALNSGAKTFMGDFEDALAPVWRHVIAGHENVMDACRSELGYETADGRRYEVEANPAVLLIRPRGWHLVERHVQIGGAPISASLFDAALFLFHNGALLAESGAGPFLYLPKLESHMEAALWQEVLSHLEAELGLEPNVTRATVLIETLPAAFEMDEILYELRHRCCGLNAGRWDYIFSTIKTLGASRRFVLPDRRAMTMTVPFMRAYTERLVESAHRRYTHAIGGMSALIPDRHDPVATKNALAGVAADKRREADDGFDGTWVAHPDLVGVAAMEFDRVLGNEPNQILRRRTSEKITADDLLDIAGTPGVVSDAGVRDNIGVALEYIATWLSGRGAVAIGGLMEDAATAEVARSQVWHWLYHGVRTADGTRLDSTVTNAVCTEEHQRLARTLDEELPSAYLDRAASVLRRCAFDVDRGLPPFFTTEAYGLLA